ncbi:hypothetical protein [uncultured Microbacterium sp.]|uniref:hypothetical protein n=1 Tax=uncultured Microbacterium sp. TaxID=191216 RepID=UPI0035C9F956
MTLTAILPTLRRSIPDPFRPSVWPEYTQVTTSDVIIAGVSLRRLVELCETPCVHTADALVPGSHIKSALRRDASVVVARVSGVFDSDDGERVVLIDADMASVSAFWDETRLLGRISTAAPNPVVILAGAGSGMPRGRGPAWVPADLAEGDLLAIPCAGMVSLHEIRPHSVDLRRGEPTENA